MELTDLKVFPNVSSTGKSSSRKSVALLAVGCAHAAPMSYSGYGSEDVECTSGVFVDRKFTASSEEIESNLQ